MLVLLSTTVLKAQTTKDITDEFFKTYEKSPQEALNSYSQEKCENFKTGKFQNLENGIVKADIERNDSIQTEKYGSKEIKLKIKWIDDCSYRLIFLEGNAAFWDSRPKDMPTYDLIVKIIATDENSYVQESKFDIDDDTIYRSKIIKVDQ